MAEYGWNGSIRLQDARDLEHDLDRLRTNLRDSYPAFDSLWRRTRTAPGL
jgi:hypothetical protein